MALNEIETRLVQQVLECFLVEPYERGIEKIIRSMAFHDIKIIRGGYDELWFECRSLQTGELHNIYGPAVALKQHRQFYRNGELIGFNDLQISRCEEDGETLGWYVESDISERMYRTTIHVQRLQFHLDRMGEKIDKFRDDLENLISSVSAQQELIKLTKDRLEGS